MIRTLFKTTATAIREGLIHAPSLRAAAPLQFKRHESGGDDFESDDEEDTKKREEEAIEAIMEDLECQEYIADIVGHGMDPEVSWANTILSETTKDEMYELHENNPIEHSTAALARRYQIREQRAAAIIALKQIEHAAEQSEGAFPVDNELATLAEELHGTVEKGTNESYLRPAFSYPKFKVLPEGELPDEGAAERARLEDEKVDQVMIRDFKENLAYNLGKVGAGLSLKSRVKQPIKHPEGGYPYLVLPLGKTAQEPFVVSRNGEKRDLDEKEAEYIRRSKAKPRRQTQL
ncbi:hypothetical protein CYMTET_26698 [Cymbomonas tetramitiformis]|uniref:Uncharacterized protein n=1 Tax=Cymbomonas tetramitiformis TaxID=36881 RepID=A0AAE0KXN0_9CHLO|nr:hypothetical protein CYMTET_26698 [Cymbomonas tetramitiformis]